MTQQHLPIWYMGQIDPSVCDKAMDEFDLLPEKDAVMGVSGELADKNRRSTIIKFADSGHWLGEIMFNHVLAANVACQWDYLMSGHENVQYGQYVAGQHYGWHTDTFTLSGVPNERKISITCLLNDPSEFEGGDFLIRLYADYKPELKKGSLIAFPSILEHQVLPITSGIRKSAVIWAYGPRFR